MSISKRMARTACCLLLSGMIVLPFPAQVCAAELAPPDMTAVSTSAAEGTQPAAETTAPSADATTWSEETLSSSTDATDPSNDMSGIVTEETKPTSQDATPVSENVLTGVAGFVARLYTVALSRTPDPTGQANWTNQLTSGQCTGITAAFGFVFSAEFTGKNYSNSDFIEKMYQLFLGRQSDPGGKQYWIDRMNGGASRDIVFAGFANSVEFRGICDGYGITQGYYKPGFAMTASSAVTNFVMRLYQVCLGRKGENTGVSEWTRKLVEGQDTGVGVAYGFLFSQEFLNNQANLDEEAYIQILYRTFLGREADVGGMQHWLELAAGGASLEMLMEGFAESNEFTNICAGYGVSRGDYTPPSYLVSNFPEVSGDYCFILGKMITLYDTADAVTRLFGTPNRIESSVNGFTYYVYNSDYRNLFMIAIDEGEVVGWLTDADTFACNGSSRKLTRAMAQVNELGSDTEEMQKTSYSTYDTIVYYDPNLPDYNVDMIYVLEDLGFTNTVNFNTANSLEKEVFDFTNSYRIHHGLSVLYWSDSAANASRQHSLDMINNNYLSIYDLNGGTPITRMKVYGISSIKMAGENIVADTWYVSNILLNYKIDESGSTVLLYPDFTRTGVGVSMNISKEIQICVTQDFFCFY